MYRGIAARSWFRRASRIFGYVTLVAVFLVNTMGFIDAETGSAFGCGHDWPLCNGKVIPFGGTLQTFIEFSHRGAAALLTVMLLLTALLVWIAYGRFEKTKFLIISAVLSVFLEAFLGAMGVIFSDPPAVLAVHFGVSLIAFVAVLLMVIRMRQIERVGTEEGAVFTTAKPPLPLRRFFVLSWIAFAYTYLAMYVGAYVTSTGDGSDFRGWPFPTESYHVVKNAFIVDIVHRSIALIFLLFAIYLVSAARRMRAERRDLYIGSVVLLVFVLTQAVTGGILVLTHLRIWAFLLHVTSVTALFSSVCYLVMQCVGSRRSSQSFQEPSPTTNNHR